MKNILKKTTPSFRINIVVLFIVFAVSSCKREFLDTTPTNQVSTADAFRSVTNAWAALNGVHRILYSPIYNAQTQGGQAGNMQYMDLMGEDVVFSNYGFVLFRDEPRWFLHRDPNHRMVFYNYQFYYAIIGNANMILHYIDNAEGSEAEKKHIKGQALVYRAWSYFQMIQLFGERYEAGKPNNTVEGGLPLVLEPSSAIVPRSSVRDVYDQINADLSLALEYLVDFERANKSHLDLSVAKGIKARVALAQQDWPTAAQYANAARQGYSLMSHEEYMGGFNDYNNREWMWGSHMPADQSNGFYSFFAFMSVNFNSSSIRQNPRLINSVLYEEISETDIRRQLWDPKGDDVENYPVPPAGSRYPLMNRKFRVANSALSIGDVPYMRAAEMYLIEAESLARQGQVGEKQAADVLFELANNRDPQYERTTNTGQSLIDEIMIQRRVELWGEGFRFYDLKRTRSPLDRRGSNHNTTVSGVLYIDADDIRWQFVIPQQEINNSNGVVKQNPL